MAGLSAETRDLDVVSEGFPRWWAATHPDDADVDMSPIQTNPTSGYSSESLLVDVSVNRAGERLTEELVLRLPPAGGGLFPEYDLQRQSATHAVLASAGTPVPWPATYEHEPEWIGCHFMVMPRIAGRIPGDYTYPRKGWLHDAEADAQHAVYTSFVDALAGLLTIDPAAHETAFLARSKGTGLHAEIGWWSDYLAWAGDGTPEPSMADAYAWAGETAPPDTDPPSIVWGDARFANTIFGPAGQVVGMLDWEQAAVGPAELDIGFWLATRRQACDVVRVTADPELPGFLDREATLGRLATGLGRPLRAIEWHELFAMVRMGTCIVATQALLRRGGQDDHPFLAASPLPGWVTEAISAGTQS